MATVSDVLGALRAFAPIERKMDFDNVGFLAGFKDREVTRILAALDITGEVIAEAGETGCELIVSHHPLFFSLKKVTDEDETGRRLTALLANGISAICMHTNLDGADGGVNAALGAAAGLKNLSILHAEDRTDAAARSFGYNRVGYLDKPTPLGEYLPFLKESLRSAGLRFFDAGRPVFKVGLTSGSGGENLKYAIESGCDTYLTADVKYDVFLEARAAGINLIDGDHFCTENVVVPVLERLLKEKFPDIVVTASKRHGQTAHFYTA